MIHPATAWEPNKLGMFAGLPMDTYQSAPGLSKSGSDVLRRSPIDYYKQCVARTDVRTATDAMQYGTLTHSLLFEGRSDFYLRPETYSGKESAKKDAALIEKPWNANSNTCKEWLAAHSDKPVLSANETEALIAFCDYIRDHRHAKQLLAKGQHAEVSMFAREKTYGKIIKCRADSLWIEQGQIFFADLKTTKDASTAAISKTILQRRYHTQAAMHKMIVGLLGQYEWGGFYLIFAESGSSPKCNVRKLAEQAIEKGRGEIEADVDLLRRCTMMGDWPEWADSEEHICNVDLPEWVYGEVETLTGMTAATIEEGTV